MSTAQHTPGIWKVFSVFADAEVRANDGTLIAVVPGRPGVRNARLIAKSPELLSELQKAHELIVLMLNELTPAAKSRFMAKADRAGLIVDGATRYHERAAVIAKATGSAA